MNEEGMQDTDNKLIHIGRPIEFDKEHFYEKLEELKEMAYAEDSADIRKKTGLYLSAGSVYGKGGERFLRLNIACPESVLKDGLERLKNGLMGLDILDDLKD